MSNAPFALDRREFIALAGRIGRRARRRRRCLFSSRRSAAHAQPVPSESGTLTQPGNAVLNGTIASPNTGAAAATTSPQTESATATNTEMPPTTLEDLPWNLRLVNRDHPLAADFAPSNLSCPTQVGGARQPPVDAASSKSSQPCSRLPRPPAHPIICSSSAPTTTRRNLFENRIRQRRARGIWKAPKPRRLPRSGWHLQVPEHQTGLAVDIMDADYTELDEGQEETATQQGSWLTAPSNGFILRYPTDKSATTGIGYEPWHYRYVGKEAASAITQSGLCLEEWLVETSTTSGLEATLPLSAAALPPAAAPLPPPSRNLLPSRPRNKIAETVPQERRP